MKQFCVVLATWMVACCASRAADLGQRVVWDAARVAPVMWGAASGMSVAIEGGAVVLKTGDVDFGWASTDDQLPVTDTTTVDCSVKQVSNGSLNVQIEWFRPDGSFIGAATLLDHVKAEASVTGRKVVDLAGTAEKPSKFRLKFWLEGRKAQAIVSRAAVAFKRSWRKPDTRLVKAFDSSVKTVPDTGVKVEVQGTEVTATLGADVPYASYLFDERVEYDKNGVVIVDVGDVQNGMLTVQAVTYDQGGAYISSVDLVKDVSASGSYEVPLQMFEDKLGHGVANLSFKVWLAGSQTNARLSGVFYGILP